MFQPQPSSERYIIIDALRGFALLGVLVTNIFLFNTSNGNFTDYLNLFPDPASNLAIMIIKGFFRGRFFPIFAFLFGLGIGMQHMKLNELGIHNSILFKRLVILLFIGFLHSIFIWEGDILLKYAIIGLLAILLAPMNSNIILFSTLTLYIIHSIYSFNIYQFESIPPAPHVNKDFVEVINASYTDLVSIRLMTIVDRNYQQANFFYTIKIMAFVLFGLFVSKHCNIKNLLQNPSCWRMMLLWLVTFRILNASISFIFNIETVNVLLSYLNYIVIPAIYVVGLVVILNFDKNKWLKKVLSYIGKMTLTNYLLQTLVLSLIFHGYGLGKFQEWPPYILFVLSIILFSFQIVFSFLWLRKFKQGPIEMLWRRFTYYKIV